MSDDRLRLIDTNILVYAYDISEAEKHSLAKGIVQEVWTQSGGAVSVQNLAEFFVVVTRKVEHRLSLDATRTIVSDILNSSKWTVIDRNHETLIKAIDLVESTGIHFWDALIAMCMLENGVGMIVTENEDDFKKVRGITVLNPFSRPIQ